MVRRPFRGAVGQTTLTNFAIVGLSLIASIAVARALQPAGRGQFATLMSVFALALVVGEVGQSASVTYHVAKYRDTAAGVVASGRRIMTITSVCVGALGFLAIWIAAANFGLNGLGYAIALAGCVINGLAAPYLYAVQAVDPRNWNVLRMIQPAAYMVFVLVAFLSMHLDLPILAVGLVLSTTLALLASFLSARTRGLTGGSSTPIYVKRMLGYGLAAACAGIPVGLGQNLDKVLLVGWLSDANIGQYAIGLTVSTMTLPFATALSSIVFPRIAGMETGSGRREHAIRTLFVAGAICVPLALAIAAVGQLAIPFVYGRAYTPAAALLWWLVPGAIFRSMNTVMSGILRGLGQPGRAAAAQICAAGLFLAALPLAVSHLGITGTGVAMGTGEATALAVGWLLLKRAPH